MICFVDTNVFLRLLVREDEKVVSECGSFIKLIKNNIIKAYTSSLVLSEVVWTLTSYFGYSKENVVEAARSIIKLRGLRFVDKHDQDLAINLFSRYSVKLIDAMTASNLYARSKKWVVVSYDRDFDKLGVIRREPGQIVKDLTTD